MDNNTEIKVRIFRDKETINRILSEQKKSNLSIKTFCDQNNIAAASFHNWKKKYSSSPVAGPGFAKLQITPSVFSGGPELFAEVDRIKIYQPVSAVYLKELLG